MKHIEFIQYLMYLQPMTQTFSGQRKKTLFLPIFNQNLMNTLFTVIQALPNH